MEQRMRREEEEEEEGRFLAFAVMRFSTRKVAPLPPSLSKFCLLVYYYY